MDVQTVYNSVICFPLEFGAIISSLILIVVSFGLAIWGMVNGGPVTIIFFLVSMTVWCSYLYGIYQKKLVYMWLALGSGVVNIFGMYVALTVVCFSAFLTENDIATFSNLFILTRKQHFVILFAGIIVWGIFTYFCYIAFCAYEKIRIQQEQLRNIDFPTHEVDIEQSNELSLRNSQSYDL